MKKYNEFIKENLSDDDKLRIMYFVEDLDKKLSEHSYEMSGSNIEFDDKEMTIRYNWYSPEEGGGDDWILSYENGKLKVEHHDEASTVFGNYDNDNVEIHDTLDDFLYQLKTQFE